MPMIIKQYNDLAGPRLFYGGTERLWFSKEKWLWLRETPDGLQPLSGVTNTVHIIDKSPVLMPWAVKKALQRVRDRLVDYRRPDGWIELLETELEEILESARKADREILEDAGDVGHVAHKWIEDFIKNLGNEPRRLELLAKLPLDERAANACIAAIDWMVRHKVEWVATECAVYSRRTGVAGTMDGLAYVSSCNDVMCCPHAFERRLSVVDWKTSNYLYVEHLLQTAKYWQMYEEEHPEVHVEDRWINRLGKDDAEFDSWHAEGRALYWEDEQAFQHALDLSRSLKAIEQRISGVKEVRKAARKLAAQAAKRIRCPKADDYKGKKKSKCFDDGTQCEACQAIYKSQHSEDTNERTNEGAGQVPGAGGQTGEIDQTK